MNQFGNVTSLDPTSGPHPYAHTGNGTCSECGYAEINIRHDGYRTAKAATPTPLAEAMDSLVDLALKGAEVEITTSRRVNHPDRIYPPTWHVTLKGAHVVTGRNGRDLAAVIAGAVAGFKAAQS